MEKPIDKQYLEEYRPQLKVLKSAKRLIIISLIMLPSIFLLVIFRCIGVENLVFLLLFWHILRRQCMMYEIQKSVLTLKRYLLEPDFNIEVEEDEAEDEQ
jgi:hypothetical protein